MTLSLLIATVLATAPAPPRVATYETIADLKGFTISGVDAWSSTGLLVVEGSAGICLFDPARPKEPPKPLAVRGSPRWAPEADWLVVEAANMRAGTGASNFCLVAVRLSDSAKDTIYTGAELWPYVWASDGKIYGWTRARGHGMRVAVEPPAEWKREHPESRRVHAVLFGVPDPFGFVPGANPSEWSLPFSSMGHEGSIFLRNAYPGDSLYLATIIGRSWPRSAVIDLHGRVVREVGDSLAEWTSVSSDGRLLIGYEEIDNPQGENILHSFLHVGDAEGSWSLRLREAPDGVLPQWSPSDYIFFARDPIADVLRIGRVTLRP
jgi:hypothetical protein